MAFYSYVIGRWVHVGVEATKHAASAQRAGQLPVDMTAAMFTSVSWLLSGMSPQ